MEIACTLCIFFRLFTLKMITAVNLNNQFVLETDEIRYIVINRMLSTKMDTYFIIR